MLRCAYGDSLVAEAQVRIAKQPRGAITELGGFRRNNLSPGVFSCPPHADSVDTWKLGGARRCSTVALRCWSEESENHGNLKQGFNLKNMLKLVCVGV